VSINEVDIDTCRNLKRVVNSPRSLEAFKRTGILFEELAPVDHAQLKEAIRLKDPQRGGNKDIFDLRLLYANKQRKKKHQLLVDVSSFFNRLAVSLR